MISKITDNFQCVSHCRLGVALALLLMGGCTDALDQTNGDLTSPVGGTLHIADQLRAQGDNEGALELYARAVQRAPDDVIARQKFAGALEAQDDNTDAAVQYRALVKLAPGNGDYRCAYGRVLIELNRPLDAREQYQAALGEQADNVRALNGLGIALDLLGDHAGAQAEYKIALAQKPDDFVTLNNLGHSYVLAGAYDDAIKVLEPQAQNPAAPAALRRNLAEAYGMAGMDVDAERVLKMDLPSAQVKKELARYRAARIKTAAPQIYADLGDFSTPDLAAARTEKIKEQFSAETEKLILEVVPEVEEEGGTPTFFARAGGFEKPADARIFCDRLRKGGAFCKAHLE